MKGLLCILFESIILQAQREKVCSRDFLLLILPLTSGKGSFPCLQVPPGQHKHAFCHHPQIMSRMELFSYIVTEIK